MKSNAPCAAAYRENLRRAGYQRVEVHLPRDVVAGIDALPGETRADRLQQALRARTVPTGLQTLLRTLGGLDQRHVSIGELAGLKRRARELLESLDA